MSTPRTGRGFHYIDTNRKPPTELCVKVFPHTCKVCHAEFSDGHWQTKTCPACHRAKNKADGRGGVE